MEGYRASPLRPPPGAKLVNVADLPFHNFEPSAELLKTPGYNLGGKLLKILKLKKKPSSTTSTHFLAMEEFQPSMQTFHFQDLITHSTQFPTPMIEDVRKRYNYDSEEHSDNSVSDTNNCCSSASIASSSRNSSTSAQSFDSNRSSGTPQSPFLSSGQLSNTQMMGNILMSIMDAADITTTTTSEELASSEDENHGPPDSAWQQQPHDENFANSPRVRGLRNSMLTGPHESAWHEPRDEFSVDSQTARRRHSSASLKHSSGRHTLKAGGRFSVDGRLTSPGPSRRFGKVDLSRIEATKFRL